MLTEAETPTDQPEPIQEAAGKTRQSIITDACSEWDSDPAVQRIARREVYVNDALREAGLPALTEAELTASQPEHVRAAADEAATEWENQPNLQHLTSKAAFVRDAIRAAAAEAAKPWWQRSVIRHR